MKNSIPLFIFLLSFISCQNSEKKNYTNGYLLTGTIEKSFNGKEVFLKTRENKKIKVLDSTTIDDGIFNFKGKIDRPVVYGIYIEDTNGLIGIFMENSNISIEANINDLSSSKITGSQTNVDYLNFVKKSNKIISEMNMLFPEFQKARAENDVKNLEKINKRMQEINDKNTAFILSYAKQNPDSYIGALALQTIISIPTVHKDSLAVIYNNFSNYVKKGDYAKEIEKYLETRQTIDSIQN